MKFNKSTFFVLPMLKLPLYCFNMGWYLNSYIRDSIRPYVKDTLILLFDEKALKQQNMVNYKLRAHPFFLDAVQLGDYVLMHFQAHEDHLQDLERFVKGQYSEFSPLHKAQILQTFPKYIPNPGAGKKLSRNYAVLNPNDPEAMIYREELSQKIGEEAFSVKELISIPNMREETFRIEDFYTLIEDKEEVDLIEAWSK